MSDEGERGSNTSGLGLFEWIGVKWPPIGVGGDDGLDTLFTFWYSLDESKFDTFLRIIFAAVVVVAPLVGALFSSFSLSVEF